MKTFQENEKEFRKAQNAATLRCAFLFGVPVAAAFVHCALTIMGVI